MSIRPRSGHWHYYFQVHGVPYSGNTGLAATTRNENAARAEEARLRSLVLQGRAHQLRLSVMPFSAAADHFVDWAKGEYGEKPNTWKRLRGSTTSLKAYFKNKPVHSISAGDIEDYKSWRRRSGVEEVTLRHDLHALSPLLQYARKHNWCSGNPLETVEVPSDAESERINVLSPAEEMLYFELAKQQSMDLYDLGRLMILQGPRPWCEVAVSRVEHVDLNGGEWHIPRSKSKASRRTLYLKPEARSILARRITVADRDGWLFPGKTGAGHLAGLQNSHDAVLGAMGKKLRETDPKAPDPTFVIYDFRHTFATRMAKDGCDIAALARILGHGNLRTVQKYIHIDDEHVKLAMQRYGHSATREPDTGVAGPEVVQ